MQLGVGAEDVFGGQAWRDTRIFRRVATAAFFIAYEHPRRTTED
jgi:hypothetical protein